MKAKEQALVMRSRAHGGVQDAPKQGPREATFRTGGPEPPVATGGRQRPQQGEATVLPGERPLLRSWNVSS